MQIAIYNIISGYCLLSYMIFVSGMHDEEIFLKAADARLAVVSQLLSSANVYLTSPCWQHQ